MVIKKFENFNLNEEDLSDEIEICFNNLISDYDIMVRKPGPKQSYNKSDNPFKGEFRLVCLEHSKSRSRWGLTIDIPHLIGDNKIKFLKKLQISKNRLKSAGFSIFSGRKNGQRVWDYSIYPITGRGVPVNRWDFGIWYEEDTDEYYEKFSRFFESKSNSFEEASDRSWSFRQQLEIPSKEIELIEKKCKEIFDVWYDKKQLSINRFTHSWELKGKKQFSIMSVEFGNPNLPNKHDFFIKKYDDEWFIVHFRKGNGLTYNVTNYICDQIEGLFDCLEYISELIN